MMYDTLETAYAKAREAQRAGKNAITLTLPVAKAFRGKFIDVAWQLTDGADSGSRAFVVRKIDPKPTHDAHGNTHEDPMSTLVVTASVIDIIDIARTAVERSIDPTRFVRRKRRPRSIAHLMSR